MAQASGQFLLSFFLKISKAADLVKASVQYQKLFFLMIFGFLYEPILLGQIHLPQALSD